MRVGKVWKRGRGYGKEEQKRKIYLNFQKKMEEEDTTRVVQCRGIERDREWGGE